MSNYVIYSNQEKSAREILHKYYKSDNNYVILKAHTQSGKTGVSMSMIKMLDKERKEFGGLYIDNIYFITGDNQDIMPQTCKDFIRLSKTYNIEKYKLNENVFFLKNSDLQKASKTIDKRKKTISYIPYNINGKRTNDEKKNKVSIPLPTKNSLIFIDESHYGTNKDINQISQFLKLCGINYMRYDNIMVKNNQYILSISATPYKEIISDLENRKNKVPLDPGKGYVGFEYFTINKQIKLFNNNSIKSNDEEFYNFFNEELYNHLKQIYNRINKWKFILVRLSKDELPYEEILGEKYNVLELSCKNSETGKVDKEKFINYVDTYKTIDESIRKRSIEKYNIDVTKPLVVIIKGTYRMGERIDTDIKKFCAAIVDLSFGKVETTEQGLLGRFCGYYKNEDFDKLINNENAWNDINIYISDIHYDMLKYYYIDEKLSNDKKLTPYHYNGNKKETKIWTNNDNWCNEMFDENGRKIRGYDTDPNQMIHEWYDITKFCKDNNKYYQMVTLNIKDTDLGNKFINEMWNAICNSDEKYKFKFYGNGIKFDLNKVKTDKTKRLSKYKNYLYVGARRKHKLSDSLATTTISSKGYPIQNDKNNFGKNTIFITTFDKVHEGKILLRVSISKVNKWRYENILKDSVVKPISTMDTSIK